MFSSNKRRHTFDVIWMNYYYYEYYNKLTIGFLTIIIIECYVMYSFLLYCLPFFHNTFYWHPMVSTYYYILYTKYTRYFPLTIRTSLDMYYSFCWVTGYAIIRWKVCVQVCNCDVKCIYTIYYKHVYCCS